MRVRLAVAVLLLDWVALSLAIALSPGVQADASWDVLVAAALLGVFAVALRPLLAAFTVRMGWIGVFAGWILAQALLVYLALSLAPGIHVADFWAAFWTSWVYGGLASVGLWFVTAGDGAAVVTHLLRTARRSTHEAISTSAPGLVMIQIDGLSAPIVEWSVRSGNLPTLSRWIRSGGHTVTEWRAQLPATTPASQAGLLHGASDKVPAFRWYEKDAGRLVVTNHPRDTAYVEAGLSDGDGLLADGGVSISNVFSGDAPTSLLTMSTAATSGQRRGPDRAVSTYLLHPYGLTRSLVLTIGEMIKEVHQARWQRAHGVEPRTERSPSYVALRGVTNVLLRDVNVTLVAEHMMRGAPAIFCDFVDYDEIAHHAGPTRPESLAALAGIDGVLGTLEQIAAEAPRPYRFVVLSDHGQSQGATFRQRYGLRLEDLVRQLMDAEESTTATDGADEQRGRVRTLVAELAREHRLAGRVGRRALADPAPVDATDRPELVVIGSGNLGLVYFPRHPGRMSAEQIEERYPGLLNGLATHPGIGFLMAHSDSRGPIALGANGVHYLASGRVDGTDPLAPFGPHAAADLRRHGTLPHAGDVLLNSRIDATTDEVAAFEELVGCHGGLGGWQTRPVLIHPAEWPVERDLHGADAVHHQLRAWLKAAHDPAAHDPATPAHDPAAPAPPVHDPVDHGRMHMD